LQRLAANDLTGAIMTRQVKAFLGLALACALANIALAAQVLYKSTMPDGKVIYGDKPVPGAVKVEEQKPDTSKAGIQLTSPGDKSALQKVEQARAQDERKDDRLAAAEKALQDAEAALVKGEEPLPGERTGTVGGKSQLNEIYWKRQQKLKDDVERARLNLEKLRAQSK
jgi:hypothetical protein